MIDEDKFIAAVGCRPIHDDLERANCPSAGKVGHYQCGWCASCDKPRFVCGHMITDPAHQEDTQEEGPS